MGIMETMRRVFPLAADYMQGLPEIRKGTTGKNGMQLSILINAQLLIG